MKPLIWAAVALLFTARQAVADVIPDPSFQENAERFFEKLGIPPEITILAIGILVGTIGMWLIMRFRKKNGSTS